MPIIEEPEILKSMSSIKEKSAELYPKEILSFLVNKCLSKDVTNFYNNKDWESLCNNHPKYKQNIAACFIGISHGIPFLYTNITKSAIQAFISDTQNALSKAQPRICNRTFVNYEQLFAAEKYVAEWNEKLPYISEHLDEVCDIIETLKANYNYSCKSVCDKFQQLKDDYQSSNIEEYCAFILRHSWYDFEFNCEPTIEYLVEDKTLIIDYILPNIEQTPSRILKERKYSSEWVQAPQKIHNRLYDDIIYSIVLRSIAEIFHFDYLSKIRHIIFNGITIDRNLATGQLDKRIILSIQVTQEQIVNIDFQYIDPKYCFKYLKGVSAARLSDKVEVTPIKSVTFSDNRIIQSKEIDTSEYQNLAEMDWEDFEHLVRQIFAWEFEPIGGEVKVTQASRDGGVDAIIFDPDPIRGGKIIIQAKRYTNTVCVSAVRDLYGTIINEGANKGILITTSDYGSDAYKFAQGKPITLLNGGHLLYLLNKHGKRAYINLEEAKNKQ